MPGFTTHYLFGLNTYRHLNSTELKNTLREYHTAYSLGLQGADIFFYHLPSYLLYTDNPGSVIHTERTGLFLHYLLESHRLFSTLEEQQISQAYICGFLGHYILDTHCHPYIYRRTGFKEKSNDYYGKHICLETDIDTKLLWLCRHCTPSSFPPEATIRLTHLERRIISSLLYYAYTKTYPELPVNCTAIYGAICSMQLGTRFLSDSSGRKKAFLHKLELKVLGYPLLSAMIPSDTCTFYSDPLNLFHRKWHNPWNTGFTSEDSFLDLITKAQAEYTSVFTALSDIFSCPLHSHEADIKTEKLLKTLGNRSYHSGLELK